MNSFTLNALSPLDGRYSAQLAALRPCFSEFALIRYRLLVEIRWLQSLAENPAIIEVEPLDARENAFLENLLSHFDLNAAEQVKAHEKTTNHDVKAVEYYLRDQLLTDATLASRAPFIHFACTSEDINNLAYALMLEDALQNVLKPVIAEVITSITALGQEHATVAMLARTHGQPASPTTLGKELTNFAARLTRPFAELEKLRLPGKCNGAVGNYNAHVAAYPEVDWPAHCEKFVNALGLSFNGYTTQIEPHDGIAAMSHLLVRINNVLLDFCRDVWTYISLGYFRQKVISTEVGSSTMPHKVNPIDFENAEGNIGLANALFDHFANKLTQSRLQRDLSDSTVLRNLGVAFGYMLTALRSITRGNQKLEINRHALKHDLDANWEVLGEAIQTVMRRYQVPNAYEQLRELTRGLGVDGDKIRQFIGTLAIPEDARQRLMALTPGKYTGLAAELVRKFP
ncbi:adenylosuccinate lyase [Legionella geestiana]|uniref:Adenylosuccinate lyase n=1 Tax=Legionella geestiana TaxID=45065 RepID=A0A0W0TSR1_9GAMM|nr:adenylosuccinate lyase [Legionella geestiana]KTC98510.1 adenylosuccinate lyase [Legionella geestiana]QBS13087.1 adenylosuccinate lyase [Legionella geestiana]STX54399.1 adenylosuccinate lyase [Legionella geestiana]